MPFTVSHAAAALPLHAWSKGRLPLAALMIGTMAPDFSYFLSYTLDFETHTFWGLLWFCLPVGLAAWWVSVRLLERPTLALVPEPWRAGMPPPTHRISFSLLVRACIAILLGGVTHIVWDSFTHAFTPVVRALPFLRETFVHVGAGRMPLYHVLQILSSVFGLAVLAIWAWRRRGVRITSFTTTPPLPPVSTPTRIFAVAALLIGSFAVALIYGTWYASPRPEERIFYLLIGGMTGWALAWCGVAAWLQLRWNSVRG